MGQAREPNRTVAPPPSRQLGRTVRRLRKRRGLAQHIVAHNAGISAATLSRLEGGRISASLDTIVSLADALGVMPSVLVRGVESPLSAQEALSEHRMSLQTLLLGVDRRGDRFPPLRHSGPAFVHVIEGRFRYRYEGLQLTLGAGDSRAFSGLAAEDLLECLSVPVRILCILVHASTPEERGTLRD